MDKKDLIPVFLLTFLTLAFFLRLFYLKPSIFVTPDFGRSDILHLNYPAKDFLSHSLKKGQIPLWTKEVGVGFPVFAEGQIGTFNFVNLILFYFLPTWLAFNLGIILAFLTIASGTYFYCRAIKLSRFSSLYAATIFTFSGFFICHLSHFNLLQTASFLPWQFFCLEKILQKKRKVFIPLLGFIFAQQIFAGFPQMVFISLLGLFFYGFYRAFAQSKQKKIKIKKLSVISYQLSVAVIITIALSAVQLLPSLELKNHSFRNKPFSFESATEYPYPPKHLLTFFSPFFFGTPKEGTYQQPTPEWGIFWENTAYLGIIPLILAIIALFLPKKSPPTNHQLLTTNYLLLATCSLALALGKFSPIYITYLAPPFNLFRIPSRFLLLTAWSLTILAAIGFEKIKKLTTYHLQPTTCYFLFSIFYFLSIGDLFFHFYSYHPIGEVEEWLQPPETAQFLEDKKARIFSAFPYKPWNEIFKNQGWQEKDAYLYFLNALNENFNLVGNIANTNVYKAMPPNRASLFVSTIENGFQLKDDHQATVSASALKLLNLSATKYIISPYDLPVEHFVKVFETKPYKNFPHYKIYENKEAFPRAYIVSSAKQIYTVEEFFRELESLNPQAVALIEIKPIIDPGSKKNDPGSEESCLPADRLANKASIEFVKDEDQITELKVQMPTNGYLVLADSFYPGWQVFVDGKKGEIIPANLNQRAVYLEKGDHLVKFTFKPKSFQIGTFISLLSLLFVGTYGIRSSHFYMRSRAEK